MRVLVVTVVHHPQDARIYYRQIESLLSHGHQVSFAAAFDSFPITAIDSRIETITLPRSSGKSRLPALLKARKLLKQRSMDFDIVLIHDPELLLIANVSAAPIIWDVHEDTVAAISAKAWIPKLLKLPLRKLIKSIERKAELQYSLILAESEYQARFSKKHPVVPNTTQVSNYQEANPVMSVIYLGNITYLRGGRTLLEVAEIVNSKNILLELVGACPEPELAREIQSAHEQGKLIWHGFIPNEKAKEMLPGKLAGLSLLQNHPNYQVSQPTKIYEYQAAGIPVITTPLVHAANLVTKADCGFIVEFDNPQAVAEHIFELSQDQQLWRRLGKNGHRYVSEHHNWQQDQLNFLAVLEDFLEKSKSQSPNTDA